MCDGALIWHITNSEHTDYRSFHGPTCDTSFSFLSALVQHVESGTCQEGIHEGSRSIRKMLHYLRLQLGQATVHAARPINWAAQEQKIIMK